MNTANLTLELLTRSDFEEVLIMLLEPDMFKYIKPHQDKSAAYHLKFLELKLNQISNGEGYYWLARNKGGSLLGVINLTPIPETDQVQIGWLIKTEFRGLGYAYEAAKSALDFGIKKTNFNPIYGVFEAENVASEKILEKLDFKFHESFMEDEVLIKKYIFQAQNEF